MCATTGAWSIIATPPMPRIHHTPVLQKKLYALALSAVQHHQRVDDQPDSGRETLTKDDAGEKGLGFLEHGCSAKAHDDALRQPADEDAEPGVLDERAVAGDIPNRQQRP